METAANAALHLIACPSGASHPATHAEVARLREEGTFLWLDVAGPDDEALGVLGDTFGFHPLAVEDAVQFGQRPKIEDYPDHVVVVAYGVNASEDELVEVHCFLRPDSLVTVRREDCPAIDRLRGRMARGAPGACGPMALHAVLDALSDTFTDPLTAIQEDVDAIDEESLQGGGETQRRIFALKRRLMTIGRVVKPQRDLLGRIAGTLTPVPGLTADQAVYFRDVHDHLLRIEGAIDANRELLSAATEVQLSVVSNRLNAVMKQLTAIATVFLPLTFLTGFFGQNFPWMVEHIGGPAAFALLGLAVPLGTAVALVAWFRTRGWI